MQTGFRTTRQARDRPELAWARDLAAMTQVRLVLYAVGGALLGLACFDLYYHLLMIIVITQAIVTETGKEVATAAAPALSPGGRMPGNASRPAAVRRRTVGHLSHFECAVWS